MRKNIIRLVFAVVATVLGAGPVAASGSILFANQDLVIRYAPQHNSEVVGRASRNDLIIVYSCSDTFCQASHPRMTTNGYVVGAELRFNASVATFPRQLTEGFGVTNRTVTLRTVPWQHGVKIAEIPAERRIKRDRCQGNFCYIFMESGTQGWVHMEGVDMDRVLNRIEQLPRPSDMTSPFSGNIPPMPGLR